MNFPKSLTFYEHQPIKTTLKQRIVKNLPASR